MITVTLYNRKDCPACDQAKQDLESLQTVIPHKLVVVEADRDPDLLQTYGQLPVVEIGPYRLRTPFTRQDLQAALGAAQDRHAHLEKVGDQTYLAKLQRGHSLTKTDRFSYWLANHYMFLFNGLLLLYFGLPFLAPVLMEYQVDGVANVIYKVYSPFCHQFAFRSWFLFGEQPAYPRALADVSGLVPYEQATGLSGTDTIAARNFIGNSTLGYKVALCERDVAIYGSILLFGLIFAATGRKLPSLPWYLWIAIGIIPIAIDGFSQLPSLMQLNGIPWLPMRESTPLLRTLTGFLFGFSTAWYGYPFIEQSMVETRRLLTHKIAVVRQESRA